MLVQQRYSTPVQARTEFEHAVKVGLAFTVAGLAGLFVLSLFGH